MLLHRRYDNSPLLFVFKWTLYELCICILRYDFNQSDSLFQMSTVFWSWWKSFWCCVFVSLGHDLKVKTLEISGSWIEVTIWLVCIIGTEHDQLWGVIKLSICNSVNRCLTSFRMWIHFFLSLFSYFIWGHLRGEGRGQRGERGRGDCSWGEEGGGPKEETPSGRNWNHGGTNEHESFLRNEVQQTLFYTGKL